METRILGSEKLEVAAIGLGCWGMSDAYGHADRAEAIATIHEALDSGINFFDTADIYGAGHNELLLGEALADRRSHALIATKFGFRGNEHGQQEICGSAAYVRDACHASLQRLKTDYVDLYYLHRVDQRVPIEETIGAMAGLVRDGKVRHIGLSEASADTIRRAHAVHPVTALQSEYSLVTRELESEILPLCRQLKIGLVAFSPLGRGLLGGQVKAGAQFAEGDYRKNLPRFAAVNLARNLDLVHMLESMAAANNATPAQVALAWVLQQGPDIVPIPGMKSRAHLRENLAAAKLNLTSQELETLRSLAGCVHGERHNADNLRFIDR